MNKKEQTAFVSACLLGDGSLRKSDKNARYALSQLATHEDYVLWQQKQFESFVGTQLTYQDAYQDSCNHKPQYRLYTKVHPFLTTLYERWYFDGRKTVSPHDLKLLDWQMLAIWYMDDGYISNGEFERTRGDMWLCTDNFTFAEISMLQKALYEKLNLPFNIRRRPTKTTVRYRLCLTRKFADAMRIGIEPYIFPSFAYKLFARKTPATPDDEIVCSDQLNDQTLAEMTNADVNNIV